MPPDPGIGKPDRLVADLIGRAQNFIEWSGDFFAHKAMARPWLVIRRVFELTVSSHEIFIHHHQHDVTEILFCLGQSS